MNDDTDTLTPHQAGDAAQPLDESASAGVAPDEGRQPHPQYPGRDIRGRHLPGNTTGLVHGAHRTLPSTLQATVRAEIRARVLSDLGMDENDAPATLSGLIDRLAETSLLCDAYFAWLAEQGGPIGTRGRQKLAVRGYLAALDRQMRLAQLIGLERRPKRAQSLADVLAEGDPLLHGDAPGDALL